MSEKRKRRPAGESQARILDAAQKRLAEGGPDALRLKDIAADLGISHPTILHHFGSRDGLIEALERRALKALQADLLQPDGTTRDAIARVSRTLGDEGHARLMVWWATQGTGPAADFDWGMLRSLGDAIHAERTAEARVRGEPEPLREDTTFVVRLVAAALFGEALIGEVLTRSAGLGDDREVTERFHAWLADWIER